MATSRSAASSGQGGAEPATRRDTGRMRLVVELNRPTAADLDELLGQEDLNKTTLVNRAVQVYALLRRIEREGGQVLVQERDDTHPQRIRFV